MHILLFSQEFTEGLAKTCLPIAQLPIFAADIKRNKLFIYYNIAIAFLHCAGLNYHYVTHVSRDLCPKIMLPTWV